MKGKKNDFSMTFYYFKKKALHLHFVHDTDKAVRWTDDENIQWGHANIYDRRTGGFIKRIYHSSVLDIREYLRELNAPE